VPSAEPGSQHGQTAAHDVHGPPWLGQLIEEAWDLALERSPCASLLLVRGMSLVAGSVASRLEPIHEDSTEVQDAALPELTQLSAQDRAALVSRFRETDEASFAHWCARLRLDIPPRGGPPTRVMAAIAGDDASEGGEGTVVHKTASGGSRAEGHALPASAAATANV